MTSVIEWVCVFPFMLGLLALIYGPGYCLATIFNTGPFVVRVAVAPAWTFAFVGLTSTVMHHLGVPWSRYSYGTVLLVLVVAAALTRTVTWRSRPPGMKRVWRRLAAIMPKALGVLAAWIVTVLPIMVMMGPREVMQGGDAPYHYNQLWLMAQTGNADPLTANQGLLGLSGDHSFYPNVWHALGALMNFHSQYSLVVGNVILLTVPLLWLIGIAVLCQRLFPENRLAWMWGLVATFMLPAFPLRLELIAGIWPYVMGVSAVPGYLVWLLEIARNLHVSRATWRVRAVAGLVPLAGLAMAHPSAAGVVFWVVAVLIVWFPAQWAVSAYTRGDRLRAWRYGAASAAIAVLIVAFVVSPGPQQSQFGRYPSRGWEDFLSKMAMLATLRLKGRDFLGPLVPVYLSVAALTLLGLYLAWKNLRYRWLCPLWLGFMGMLLGSLVSIPFLTHVSSLHYADSYRVVGTCTIVVAPLLVLAMSHLVERYSKRSRYPARATTFGSAVLVVAVATALLLFPLRSDLRSAIEPEEFKDSRYSFDSGELDMMRRLASEVPRGEVVIGDPAVGTAFLPAVSDVKVVWPYMGFSFSDPDGKYLEQHFSEIRYDPRVCQIVRDNNIHYYYQDRISWFNGAPTTKWRPGLYAVDVSRGFTLVDQGGTASLYRIDECWQSPSE